MKKFVIFMVGTSGSGKTTIGNALGTELRKYGQDKLEFIDGDIIRAEFGGIFGYTFEERMRANQAARVVIKYLLKHGISVVLAQVGAYEAMRKAMREAFSEYYVEVYVKCSYEECARRDVKGYYAKQKKGEMDNLNGVNDSFEIPQSSNLIIDTELVSVEQAVEMIINYLKENYEL